MADIQAPVLTSTDPEQLEIFVKFITQLRDMNNVRVAEQEAKRLKPYFDALGKTLAADQKEADNAEPDITDLSKPGTLSKLFTQVAKDTRSTILSGIIIAPQTLLETPEAKNGATQFSALSAYNDHSFTFGFIQIFESNGKGSISIPVLGFKPELMANIEPFRPAAMLTALQTIAVSSNHDMQHHYTSTILNPNIAKDARDKGLPQPDFTVNDWNSLYFNQGGKDSDPNSYEAWLMFNHARVRRRMENGPEGDALKEACDACLAELKRIGKEITAAHSLEKAHEAVDYFGTMMLVAMMRSMPLNHSFIDYAIRGLQQADPDPGAIERKKERMIRDVNDTSDPYHDFMVKTLSNYKAYGTDLLSEEQDYVSPKKLQLVMTEPWVAHLMSPGQPDTELSAAQQRVGDVNRDMINASALTSWFSAIDGLNVMKRSDGTTLEAYFENGAFHRTDGPAVVLKNAYGEVIGEHWFKDGQRYRADGGPTLVETKNMNGGRVEIQRWHDEKGLLRREIKNSPEKISRDVYEETWYDESGKMHREDGPACQTLDAEGNPVEEEWYLHGELHNENGPAYTVIDIDGSHLEEQWKRHGKWHREGGPANVEKDSDGSIKKEEWYLDGEYHRDNGPAYIHTNPAGIHSEVWYKNGIQHREDGPANLTMGADGKIIKEIWIRDGQRHREDRPAYIGNYTTGIYEEEWYKDGKMHREDGPAHIKIMPDGLRVEQWYLHGQRTEPQTKQQAPLKTPYALKP